MSTVARLVALGAMCSAVVAASIPTPVPVAAEAPLSCLPAAQPFFAQAWEALANVHHDEARERFAQTVAVDPDCVLAWAHLAALTPGSTGKKMMDDALNDSVGISDVEKLEIQALAAVQRGEGEQALTLTRKERSFAPRSYRVLVTLAIRAGNLGRWNEAAEAARRAGDLEPLRGPAWNQLGYASMALHRPEAVEAFQRYADAAPMEPNAHDSLGDALLANNKLESARAAYQRALDTSGGSFWASGHGVATVCAIEGDWFCARAAIEKARRSAPQLDDRLRLTEWTAWSYLASHDPEEAFRAIDELEHEARTAKLEARVTDALVLRARFMISERRGKDAITVLNNAGKTRFTGLTEGERLEFEGRRLHALTEAYARTGKMVEAEKTLTSLRTVFESRPRDQLGIDLLAHARGVIALQRRDPSLAISAFMQCSDELTPCQMELANAQEQAGDKPAATLTRTMLTQANRRSPEYWWVRARALNQLGTPLNL